MRPQRAISPEDRIALEALLKKAKTKADFQRIQCVWLRILFGFTSELVAQAVGWRPGTVKKIWSDYFSRKEKALLGKGRGGRRRANLSLEEETRLLGGFFRKAEKGGILVANEVKAAYEKAIGREVPKSTIYRMLARHGWRKVAPRPHHPQSDPNEREAFKKNCPSLSGKKRNDNSSTDENSD